MEVVRPALLLLGVALVVVLGVARWVQVAPARRDVPPFLSGSLPTEHAVSRYHVRWYTVSMEDVEHRLDAALDRLHDVDGQRLEAADPEGGAPPARGAAPDRGRRTPRCGGIGCGAVTGPGVPRSWRCRSSAW